MNIRDYKLISPTAKKSITAEQFNDDRYWFDTSFEGGHRRIRNKEEEINKAVGFKDAIGVLYRCIDVRSATIASLPWALLRGKDVIVDSESVRDSGEDGFGWLDGLTNLLYLTESSLLLTSEAFWLKEQNLFGKNLNMRWLASPYIQPIYEEAEGLVGFKRLYGIKSEQFSTDEIVYFWVQDPTTELTPDIPQAVAAASSAEVILNYENFVSKFYERGAVKATILKVDRSTPPRERTRLREFWQSFMSGGSNAYATEVVSGDVEAEVIGEGAGDSERTEVLVSRRKDIATAMGVPYSLLFGDTSSSYTAGPTEEKNFLNYTVVPRAKLIQNFLNRQVFGDDLYFRFNIAALPAFREANKIVSDVFSAYTTALIPHSIAAKLAGIVLPEGTSYEDLDVLVAQERERQFKEKERIVTLNSKINQESGGNEKPKGEDNNLKQVEERRLRKWLKNRKNAALEDFESEILTPEEMRTIFIEQKGVATEQPPFGMSKALNVFGDEDLPVSEELLGIEAEASSQIEALFGAQVDAALKQLKRKEDYENIEGLFSDIGEDLQNYIVALLLSYADFGVEAATDLVRNFYPHFDNTDATFKAREWAAKRAIEVFAIVQATSIRKAKAIYSEWKLTTLPVEWLEGELRKAMSLERAKLIAENESMAVVNRAAIIVYESVGVVQFVRWTATMDERTCPICGVLHGKTYQLNSAPRIPAHPRCRCWLRPVVDSNYLRWVFEMERARLGG